MQRGAHVLDCK